MKIKIFIFALTVLLIGGMLLWYSLSDSGNYSQAPTEEELSRAMADRFGQAQVQKTVLETIPNDRVIRVAIGDVGLPLQRKGEVEDLLLANLMGSAGLEFVERQELEKVLSELQMSRSGIVRASDAVKIGKLIRVDWFLLGSSVTYDGTKSLVVRVVDARSGVMLDADVLNAEGRPTQTATALSGFLNRTRENASTPKLRTFISIGGFQDLGMNSRQAAFPNQLRSYFNAAFRGSDVAMLEREFARTLLQEVHLDMAGLTEAGAAEKPAAMQSAYWLIDGFFQSYETTEFQVELVLNVRRMFGRSKQVELRGKPGEPLLKQAKEAVERIIAEDNAAITPTRVTELRSHLAMAKELAGFSTPISLILPQLMDVSERELQRRKRNTEEAIQLYQTALLLDPGNREATISLAACYRLPEIGKLEESRDLYRQIIESTTRDQWTDTAKKGLEFTFKWQSPEASVAWFRNAAQQTSNSAAKAFYEEQLKKAGEDFALSHGGTPGAEKIAEERLIKDMAKWEGGTSIIDFYNTGIGKYVEAFGTNTAAAASKLVALLPKLQETAPKYSPHILAGVVSYQVDTNAAIVAEFRQALTDFAEHPEKIHNPEYFFRLLASPVRRWSEQANHYSLTAKIIETCNAASEKGYLDELDSETTMSLGYSLLKAEAWQDALTFFQSYSNRPVPMGNSGPWGKAFTTVLPSKQVELCREKLGLPQVIDSREFDMGTNVICMHTPSAFFASAEGVWVGIEGRMVFVTHALTTNESVALPMNPRFPITVIKEGTTNFWIGTDGAGLFSMDKQTRQVSNLREQDGLFMDSISALNQVGNTLWIGYGSDRRGGLGKIDVSTSQIKTYTASVLASAQAESQPVASAVKNLSRGSADALWILASGRLWEFDIATEKWKAPERGGASILGMVHAEGRMFVASPLPITKYIVEWKDAVDPTKLKRESLLMPTEKATAFRMQISTNKMARIVKSSGNLQPRGALRSFARAGETERLVSELVNSPTTLNFLDGDLWVGGVGYIARVDPATGAIEKFAYVPTRMVEELQMGGGYLWAKYEKHLHRAALKNLR